MAMSPGSWGRVTVPEMVASLASMVPSPSWSRIAGKRFSSRTVSVPLSRPGLSGALSTPLTSDPLPEITATAFSTARSGTVAPAPYSSVQGMASSTEYQKLRGFLVGRTMNLCDCSTLALMSSVVPVSSVTSLTVGRVAGSMPPLPIRLITSSMRWSAGNSKLWGWKSRSRASLTPIPRSRSQ